MLSLSAIAQFHAEIQRDLQDHSISSQPDNTTSYLCYKPTTFRVRSTFNIHEVVPRLVMTQFVISNEN